MPIPVLHVRASDRFGGPERLILEAAARARATAPTVASFGREGAPHPLLDPCRARGVATALVAASGSYDPRAVWRLRRTVVERGARVVVGHDYRSDLLVWAATKGLGVRRAAVVHGFTAEDRKVATFEALDRRVLRRADAVVAVAAPTRDALVAAGVPAARVHLVENAIDVEAVAAEAREARAEVRRSLDLPDGTPMVLALGRLSPEKGHAVLLDAWAEAAPERAVLCLVGDGASADALRRRAATLPPGGVRFLGWRSDPARCLGAADLFVLPSLREGLPLAVLEAMAAGVPVVASAVGGVPEALGGGWCGTLVPPGDAGALARALRSALADLAAARATAQAALERVRERYDVGRQVEALEALWTSLA